MDEAIDRTIEAIQTEQAIDWNSMLDLIHLTAVERSLKNQIPECGKYFRPDSPAQGVFRQSAGVVSVDYAAV